jgi:ParB family chromosome partitioning protein
MSAREPITHELKCHPGPYDATERGDKPFEFRKDDRDYRVGDTLWLRRWDPDNHAVVVDVHGDKEHPGVEYVPRGYNGRECRRLVTYIIREGFGIPPGYCIMALSKLEAQPSEPRLAVEQIMEVVKEWVLDWCDWSVIASDDGKDLRARLTKAAQP